ncbi:MAG: hypothetical protein K0U38_09270 [Epsilonproteobacteria bacterium]|nr:hypothetical protein [Campylobacterota bacterium]
MKQYIMVSLWSVLPTLLLGNGLEYKGNIGMEASYLNHDMNEKRESENAFRLEAELQQRFENGKIVANLKALYDLNDKERRYFDFNDLYYKHNFENGDLLIGRNTRFWGAMEFYNHTDVFNTKDWLDNPFDYDSKIGANNIAYTHYFDNAELSVIAKVREENQKIQDGESVNSFLPPTYKDTLETGKDRNRPTLYLKYSGSAEKRQLDYSLIYQNGYDEQRYLAPVGNELRQHAYIVDKVMGYATLVEGETIYKTELAYTQSDDESVSDYAQISIGAEHTLYGILDKKDLGILVEYYRYKSYENNKMGAKELGNLFADDIALGFRVSMNDMSDSEILGGVSIDRDTREKIFFVEYDTRLFEKYKLGLSYQHLAPKDGSVFKELDRAMIEFGYYF